jgi:uncharacterized protein
MSIEQDIRHDAANTRFVIDVDGHQGVVDYDLQGRNMRVLSTRVPPAIGNRGIAAALTEAALRYADKEGLTVVPVCSYTVAYLKRRKPA